VKTIETDAIVTNEGQLNLNVSVDLAPGQYKVVLVVEENTAQTPKQNRLNLPVIDVGPWPENFSLRREDMYGDDGR